MKAITTVEILAITQLKSLYKRYGWNLSECQINWAVSEMERGSHSLTLYALAGMSYLDNPFEVSAYFSKALEELNIEIPNKQQAIKNYVAFICKKIIDRKLSEYEGCEVLANICIDLNYQDYSEWYNLLEKLDMELITEIAFKKSIQEKAQTFLTMMKK